jgi:hypothetical protein
MILLSAFIVVAVVTFFAGALPSVTTRAEREEMGVEL